MRQIGKQTAVYILLIASTAVLADGPFKDVSYEEALKFAQKENKPILIDFYTTWCGPCKEMDQTVFKDEKAIRFLKEKTIAIKVDADKNKKLADKFKIVAFPTFVAVKPTGEEMDRLEGAITQTNLFLEEIGGILSGKDALARAADHYELIGGKDNPSALLEYVDKLTTLKQYEKATALLLWCYDKAYLENDEYSFFRAYVPLFLNDMSENWPQAKEELNKRKEPATKAYNDLKKKLAEEKDPQERDKLASQAKAILPAYIGYAAVEGNGDTPGQLFETFSSDNQKELARAVFPFVYLELLQQHEYAKIAEYSDIEKEIADLFAQYERTRNKLPTDKKEYFEAIALPSLTAQAAQYYQIYLGLGKTDQAAKIAARILNTTSDSQAYNTLAWNGYLSGRPVRENLLQARKAYKLENEKNVAILDTLLRVLDKLGKKEEACELLNKEMPKYKDSDSEYDKLVLWQCGQDIGCEIKE